jgi:hypothetical protein
MKKQIKTYWISYFVRETEQGHIFEVVCVDEDGKSNTLFYTFLNNPKVDSVTTALSKQINIYTMLIG